MDLDVLVRDYYRPRVAAYLDLLRGKIASGSSALTDAELDGAYAPIERAFMEAPLPPQPPAEQALDVVRDLLAAD